jgi:hypothetical protein
MRLMMTEQLFEFVLSPEVEATNKLSERQLRNSALARHANRTNKTDTGATRQTHILSVLESLRRSLSNFTIHRLSTASRVTYIVPSACFSPPARRKIPPN